MLRIKDHYSRPHTVCFLKTHVQLSQFKKKIAFFSDEDIISPKKYQLKILLIPNQTKAGKQKRHMKSLDCYRDKNNDFTQILVK